VIISYIILPCVLPKITPFTVEQGSIQQSCDGSVFSFRFPHVQYFNFQTFFFAFLKHFLFLSQRLSFANLMLLVEIAKLPDIW